jgi:hypothetical protein
MSQRSRGHALDGLLAGVARWQVRRPWPFVVAAMLSAVLSIPVIAGWLPGVDGLSLESDFRAMLPESARSVRDFSRIEARTGGNQPLSLTLEVPSEADLPALRRFVRDLAGRIESLEGLGVLGVDWNLEDFVAFVETHHHLYASLDDLEEVRDALEDRLAYEQETRGPWNLGLDDGPEEAPPEPEEVVERIQQEADAARAELDASYPEGFFQHPERPLLMIVVQTSIVGASSDEVDALEAEIRRLVRELDPDSYAEGMEILYGGTVIEVRDETESLVSAVRNATLLTVFLVMLAIYAFFLRVRPIPLLTLALLPPVLVTFAVAELTVDYLNASSAFLSSIVVGNGINANIIWLSRYFEARRAGKPLEQALVTSNVGTWRGTLTAALAATAAFASLITTDFRGFRDFGIVGGTGMVLCWVAAYTLLPSLATVWERAKPLTFRERGRRHRGIYGVLFARLGLGRPRLVLRVAAVFCVVSVALVGRAVAVGPVEMDFRNLRTVRPADSEPERVVNASRAIFPDTQTGSGMVVLADSPAQVAAFEAQLEALREERPRAFGEVKTLQDLLPDRQREKIRVLAELRELMLEVRPRVSEALQARIDAELPPEALEPVGPDDLPVSAARPFTERDGTRGELLVIEHHPERSDWDGEYLMEWSAAARTLRAEGTPEPPPVAGIATVFADLVRTVHEDGPRTVLDLACWPRSRCCSSPSGRGHERCR